MNFDEIPVTGNAALNPVRKSGLGYFHVLSDELVFRIIKLLSNTDVLRLSETSRAFFFYADDDIQVWKRRCLARWRGEFVWKDSWKRTALLPEQAASRPALPPKPALRGFYSRLLCAQWRRQYVPLERLSALPPGHRPVPRRAGLSPSQFAAEYMTANTPVIFTDVVPAWSAARLWRYDALAARFGMEPFKTDEVIDGKKIYMPLARYLEYARSNADDDPIYLFDPDFADHAPSLLDDYTVPPLFSEDLLAALGEDERPLYRWFVLGPARSGSCFHLDPYQTSAWNGLCHGRKRWLLYPPGCVPPGVRGDVGSDGDVDYDAPDPLEYMLEHYPHIPPSNPPYECILEPGELIFVPTGWWHMVVNLTNTVAVTQNVMNRYNFYHVYDDIRKDDKKMKKLLKKNLKRTRPDIYREFLSSAARHARKHQSANGAATNGAEKKHRKKHKDKEKSTKKPSNMMMA